LYLENGKTEYTITTRFKLDDSSNQRGGLGILFESTISSSERPEQYNDSGYILQFDRNYADGELTIRPRSIRDGRTIEGNPLFRSTGLLPPKTDDWWVTEKELTLSVTRNSSNQPVISASIKDIATENIFIVLERFTHNSIRAVDDPSINYTGLRTWHNIGATIYEMKID
jgi:hypothetical protein